MKTPQNLPALIKEMQERAREKLKPEFTNTEHVPKDVLSYSIDLINHFWGNQQPDLDKVVADTANAILEYVKGVAGRQKRAAGICGKCNNCETATSVCESVLETRAHNQALTDLIARLTSKPCCGCPENADVCKGECMCHHSVTSNPQ
jgi:hypothetical protein